MMRPPFWLPAALLATSVAAAPPVKTPVDYGGRPFVTTRAPKLKFERRTTPHPYGIDYPFAEQTARGVTLFDRFPAFSLSDCRIHLSGPWYDSMAANGHFTHGITSVEAMPNFRQGPADIRQVPAQHKWQLMTDPLFWGAAGRLADSLAKANPADPRIPALRLFADKHKITPDEEAFRELGRWTWREEAVQADSEGHGVLYPCIDIECSEGWEYQRRSYGWIYQGIAEAAKQAGAHAIPISYGQWTFSVGTVWESMRQGGKGDPEYLLPEKDFLSEDDPTITGIRENQGVVSMDGYMQAIWGNEPFYKRDSAGAPVLKDGLPVFNDAPASTTAYGQQIPLEPGEAPHCLSDLYRQAARMYLMYHRYAGAYPSQSGMCKPFLEGTRIGAWTRITNEGLQGINQNDRPLPPWEMEALVGFYLMTADDIVVWSSDTNVPPTPLGADHTKAWKYDAAGVVEYIVKAAHRYSALDPIHKGPFKWCWFQLPMVNKNETPGDRFFEKPLVIGKIRTFEGKPWLEFYAAYPALDNQPGTLEVWAENGGKRSKTYALKLRNGRSYFYDAWQLPDGLGSLEGKNIHLRFTDVLGKVHNLVGDWRENHAD